VSNDKDFMLYEVEPVEYVIEENQALFVRDGAIIKEISMNEVWKAIK